MIKDETKTVDGTTTYTEVYNVGSNTLTVEVVKDGGETHGTLEATGVTSGSTTAVTLTPNAAAGYRLASVIVERVESGDTGGDQATANARRRATPAIGHFITATKQTDGSYTFTMGNENVLVQALFAEKPVAPTMSYDKPTRTITIVNTAGNAGTLHYTLNGGTEQTTSDLEISTIISVNTTVVAWITDSSNESSDMVENTYYVAAKPTVSYTDGENQVNLALTAASTTNTADAKLYYTTDGTEPTTSSTQLTANTTIPVEKGMTVVKVLALDADNNYSEVVEQDVEYVRYLTVNKEWMTFYSAEEGFTVPDGLEVYTVSAVTPPDNGQSGTLTLTEQSIIPASTPVLIYNSDYATTTKFSTSTTTGTATGEVCSEFKYNSAAKDMTVGGPYYILKDSIFLRCNSGTLPAGSCYLDLTSTSYAPARFYSLVIGDGTTGIHTAVKDNHGDDGVWYNLNGVYTSQPTQKGVYIHNG